MKIKKSIISSCMVIAGKNKLRPRLECLAIEYKPANNALFVVGSNGYVMLVEEVIIEDPQDRKFCEKHFINEPMQCKSYRLPVAIIKDTNDYVEFGENTDGLTCNGEHVEISINEYPMWESLLPRTYTDATVFCAFNPDHIKLVNKALGLEKAGIECITPMVSAHAITLEDSKNESKMPHIWARIGNAGELQKIVIMPVRLN